MEGLLTVVLDDKVLDNQMLTRLVDPILVLVNDVIVHNPQKIPLRIGAR
jgi:hypothetical protein